MKALQAVFKGRVGDAKRPETTIERCDVTIQEGEDTAECRLIIKMLSKHGMLAVLAKDCMELTSEQA